MCDRRSFTYNWLSSQIGGQIGWVRSALLQVFRSLLQFLFNFADGEVSFLTQCQRANLDQGQMPFSSHWDWPPLLGR